MKERFPQDVWLQKFEFRPSAMTTFPASALFAALW